MSERLAEKLRQRIRENGPMPFSEWMEACLYDPDDGYYMKPGRKTGYGRDADFVTPPTLHPFFAVAVAKEIRDAWERAGQPTEFTVWELGGGEGHLARGALAWLDKHVAALGAAIRWNHTERSPVHSAVQKSVPDRRLSWLGAGVQMHRLWPGVSFQADFVLLCEVLDAVPFNVIECVEPPRRAPDHEEDFEGRWARVGVTTEGSAFALRTGPLAPPEALLAPVDNRSPTHGPLALLRGQRVIDRNDAIVWLDDVADSARGPLLIVDYGDVSSRLWTPDRTDAAVRGFSGHQVADVLDAPGDVDITGSVDFTETAVFLGRRFREVSLEPLESFLLRHGILDELNSIDRSTTEGASSYLRLRQLLLPTGLGAAFKVQRFDRIKDPRKGDGAA